MPKRELVRLMKGFRQFQDQFFSGGSKLYETLNGWQGPKSLFIGCSDSRTDPALLTSSGPGDLFVVRNIANLVPPYEVGGGHHGVSSAIEYAVVNLNVENIVILGHRQCGGIRALLEPEATRAGGFVQRWMSLAESAKQRAIAAVGTDDKDALWRRCELESIRGSLENLRSFPFVEEAIRTRGMALYGMYFDLERGELLDLDEKTGTFSPVSV